MTDQDVADAVASKLTGELYVGQRVRFINADQSYGDGIGVITELDIHHRIANIKFPTAAALHRQQVNIFFWALRPVYEYT